MNNTKYISVVDTAKLVRAALKTAYPSIKFSVTSKSYSGGASIDVRWTDGPTTKEVDPVIKRFAGASFDGMEDLKSYHTSELNGETVHFGADYVFSHREFSAEFLTKIAREVCQEWGEPMPEIKTYKSSGSAYVNSTDYKRIGGSMDTLVDLIHRKSHETSAIPVGPAPAKTAPKSADITATWHDHQWVISGNTYPHRQILKDAGAHWNKSTQSWIVAYDPDGVYYTMELPATIRAILSEQPAGETSPTIPTAESATNGDYDWREDHNVYPRDSEIIDPVKVEFYTYAMLNRPAGYGTCPDGRLVDRDFTHLLSEQWDDYGTVTYTRKLTPAELYKWEMAPASDNAYTFAVGETVIRTETDEVCTVSGHLLRNRYLVQFDSYRWSVIEMDLHASEIKEDDRPIQGPPEPPQSPVFEDGSHLEYERDDQDLLIVTASQDAEHSHFVRKQHNREIVLTFDARSDGALNDAFSFVKWGSPQDLDPIPPSNVAIATSESDNHCSLCGRSIPASLTLCGTCQARKDRYEGKRSSRINRLQNQADKRDKESASLRRETRHMAEIMNGQPILIGHHSEKRHRRAIERMHNKDRKAFQLSQEADNLRRRAAAAQSNRAISSDDPEALILLREKLATLEAHQAEMKRINALIKKVLAKDKKRLAELDAEYKKASAIGAFRVMTPEEDKTYRAARSTHRSSKRAIYTSHAAELATLAGISESQAISFLTPDDLDRIGYPSYELTNNNANIRRIKQRIATLEKTAQKVTESVESDDVVKHYPHDAIVTHNAFENRLQIAFPGKPAPDIIKRLKQNGFHWSRTAGVWQRMLTPQAIASLSWILGQPIEEAIPAEPLILEDGSHLEYPRDDQIFEPVKPMPAEPKQLSLL